MFRRPVLGGDLLLVDSHELETKDKQVASYELIVCSRGSSHEFRSPASIAQADFSPMGVEMTLVAVGL